MKEHAPAVRDYLAVMRRWANLAKGAGQPVLDHTRVVEHPEIGVTSVEVTGTEVFRAETWLKSHGPEVQSVVQPFLVLSSPDDLPCDPHWEMLCTEDPPPPSDG